MNLKLIFESGDPVLIGVFVFLLLMSVATWTVLIVRSIKLHQAKRANANMRKLFWQAKNLDDAERIAKQIDSPMSEMLLDALKAERFYSENNHSDLSSGVPLSNYLLRQVHHKHSQIMRRFENGMTILATVGSTAPFIGLFGTVWGIYHALINISKSGQMNIAAVAGPIGEALVATAFGLFVAIPAVLAYNALIRGNKKLNQDMHAFAHDLHIQILHQSNSKNS